MSNPAAKGAAKAARLAEALEEARGFLGYGTLETRNRDALDFHSVSVATLRELVRMAFEAGYAAAGGEPELADTPEPDDVQVRGQEFPSADAALQHVDAAGRGAVIRVWDKHLVVEQEEADRLAAAGVRFAYVCESGGRVYTVPVN